MHQKLIIETRVREGFRAFVPTVFAEAPGFLGVEDSKGRVWLELESDVSAPDSDEKSWPFGAVEVARARGRGLIGHAPAAPVSTQAWSSAIDGRVDRTDVCGATIIADVVRGPNEVRSLWWLKGENARRLRNRVTRAVRIEVLGDDLAVLLDPERRCLELVVSARESVVSIPLPAFVFEDLEQRDLTTAHRLLAVTHDRTIVSIAGRRRLSFFRADSLRALAEASSRAMDATITWVPIRVTGARKSDELQPTFDELEVAEVTCSTHIPEDPKIVVPEATRQATQALAREGKLSELSESLLETLVEGRTEAGILGVLRNYYCDPESGARRSASDHFLLLAPKTDPKAVRSVLEAWIPDLTIEGNDAGAVIESCNAALRQRNDRRRFLAIDTASDDEAYLLVDQAAARNLDAAGIPVFAL